MPGAYFLPTARGFEPQEHAQGPWSPDMLHGRLLGGLAARAIEARTGGPGMVATRLTVDLFRAAPMEPVTVTAEVLRSGRRIQSVDALVSVGGHVVARATALLLRASTAPPGRIWRPEPWSAPHPETLAPGPEGDTAAWVFRTASGGFGTGERTRQWSRDTAPLVDGEALSPFVRAAVSADMASPLANASDDGLHYINADYSLAMAREPIGEWIGLEVAQQLAEAGLSVGACTLYDLHGPFGTSTASALANPPLRPA